jgi:hypothetical protein
MGAGVSEFQAGPCREELRHHTSLPSQAHAIGIPTNANEWILRTLAASVSRDRGPHAIGVLRQQQIADVGNLHSIKELCCGLSVGRPRPIVGSGSVVQQAK